MPNFNLSASKQLKRYVNPTWEAIVDTVETVEEGLQTMIKRIKPDVIVLDTVIMFPAIINANCSWIRIVSCAETAIPDANIPPFLSGLSAQDLATAIFESAYLKPTCAPHKRYNLFRNKHQLPPFKAGCFIETSPTLNLLLAPSAIRHQRINMLPISQFSYTEDCVRQAPYMLPRLPKNDGPLIYLSFGSLGAFDSQLITAMLKVLPPSAGVSLSMLAA